MSEKYLSILDKLADEYGVPREQVRAIFELETRSGKAVGTSSAGARGLMQLMPGTARDMGVRNINDPVDNMRGGVKYYAQQLKAFKDPALAAAAYNAGPGRVQRAGGVPRIRETQNYVRNFRNMLGVTPGGASATVPQDGELQGQAMDETETQGALGMLAPEAAAPPSELAALREAVIAHSGKEAAMLDAQFKAAQERIQKMYGGPSSSERLWALSQALLAPKPYRGWAGTMYNVSGIMGDMADYERETAFERDKALLDLQQSYDKRKLDSEGNTLELRYKIAKEDEDTRREALKAMAPKYDVDPISGRYRVRPGTGGAPPMNGKGQYVVRTPAQAKNVPAGEAFVYAGDPDGKIYYGR